MRQSALHDYALLFLKLSTGCSAQFMLNEASFNYYTALWGISKLGGIPSHQHCLQLIGTGF